MNRADKRAIEFGKGRNKPMIEIVDIDSAEDYAWLLMSFDISKLIFNNNSKLFITYQLEYMDIRDEFEDSEQW